MSSRRDLIARAGTLALVLALPLSAVAQTTVLKAADVHPAGHPSVVAIENLGGKLQAGSQGRYKVHSYPGGVFGSEREIVEQAQAGTIQIARISPGALAPVVPELSVLRMPFMFRSEAHMRKVIDGEIGEWLLERITASPARLVALGWMDSGARGLSTRKPVRSITDLKGQKIRTMGSPPSVDALNAMGADGVSMSPSEVSRALQSGSLDGTENNPSTLYTSGQYTAGIKQFTQTQHLIVPDIVVMSRLTWDKMGKDNQALLRKFSREAQKEQRALWDRRVADHTAKLKAAGIAFVSLDQKPFIEATAPMRAKDGAPHDELIKRIEAVR